MDCLDLFLEKEVGNKPTLGERRLINDDGDVVFLITCALEFMLFKFNTGSY